MILRFGTVKERTHHVTIVSVRLQNKDGEQRDFEFYLPSEDVSFREGLHIHGRRKRQVAYADELLVKGKLEEFYSSRAGAPWAGSTIIKPDDPDQLDLWACEETVHA